MWIVAGDDAKTCLAAGVAPLRPAPHSAHQLCEEASHACHIQLTSVPHRRLAAAGAALMLREGGEDLFRHGDRHIWWDWGGLAVGLIQGSDGGFGACMDEKIPPSLGST